MPRKLRNHTLASEIAAAQTKGQPEPLDINKVFEKLKRSGDVHVNAQQDTDKRRTPDGTA